MVPFCLALFIWDQGIVGNDVCVTDCIWARARGILCGGRGSVVFGYIVTDLKLFMGFLLSYGYSSGPGILWEWRICH